ncbi:hypothetical protein D3C83_264810 [compost metagenome]
MPRPEDGERISDSGHSVKVINIDPSGKVRLSRKALLQDEGAPAGAAGGGPSRKSE